MPATTRTATPEDLDRIADLTAGHRRRLAGWSPQWWRPSAAADELHPLWLEHLVRDAGAVVRVVEADDRVVGCAASLRRPDGWVVDDVALAHDDLWPGAGRALLEAVTERPARTCVAAAHDAARRACRAAGLEHVSSYWVRPTPAPAATPAGGPQPLPPLPGSAPVPPPAPHTFGPGFDPSAPGALAFAGPEGQVVGSPPTPAPPVYDPGGTVCIVDRVVGGDRSALLRATLAAAARRGDVLVTVVAAAGDRELQDALAGTAFVRTVDVYDWPPSGGSE